MVTDIKLSLDTIPPAALEAAALTIHDMRYGTHLYSADDIAREAALALLEAWPNRVTVKDDGRRQTYIIPAIILPLKETDNDKA